MLDLSEKEYSECVAAMNPCYQNLNLSVSKATVVVNAKALFHIFPDLISTNRSALHHPLLHTGAKVLA